MSGPISHDAKAVAAMLHVFNNITYKMVEQQPTQRAYRAFAELVDAGIARKVKHKNGSVSYQRVTGCHKYALWLQRQPIKTRVRLDFDIACPLQKIIP